jgi:hypothetical protein
MSCQFKQLKSKVYDENNVKTCLTSPNHLILQINTFLLSKTKAVHSGLDENVFTDES